MRRKLFNHYADTLPKMLVGWRMGTDLNTLAALPDGVVQIDVLRGEARSEGKPVELWIAGELQAWLAQSLIENGLAEDVFDAAVLKASITKTVGKGVELRWSIHTELRSGPDVYRSELTDVHRWSGSPGHANPG
ncbi:MAG: hypothetical protein AB8H79_06060 [Myxococcota bacterium]